MTRLAFLGFILAVLVTPVQAQTQQPAAPLGFNGHVFDPPVQQYETPPTVRVRPSDISSLSSVCSSSPDWVRWSLLLGFTGAALPVKARATTRRDYQTSGPAPQHLHARMHRRRSSHRWLVGYLPPSETVRADHASAPTIIVNYILRVL